MLAMVAESCWLWCYQGDVVCGVMSLLSLAGGGAVEVTLGMA
jgi:hypothetical protein